MATKRGGLMHTIMMFASRKPTPMFCICGQRWEKILVPLELSPRAKKCGSSFIKYDQWVVITWLFETQNSNRAEDTIHRAECQK